jgi:hypothetical protein
MPPVGLELVVQAPGKQEVDGVDFLTEAIEHSVVLVF